MMELVREGKAIEDLWPEYKEEGQTYAIRRFTGTMVTKENFREIMGKYAGE
jgi:L-arabinose transport system substrate-binding protein